MQALQVAFPGKIGEYVDWYKVEALGSVQSTAGQAGAGEEARHDAGTEGGDRASRRRTLRRRRQAGGSEARRTRRSWSTQRTGSGDARAVEVKKINARRHNAKEGEVRTQESERAIHGDRASIRELSRVDRKSGRIRAGRRLCRAGGTAAYGKSVAYYDAETKAVSCYHSHPPLKLPGTELVIYGGSCISPVVKDADVYIGFDAGMTFTERALAVERRARSSCSRSAT